MKKVAGLLVITVVLVVSACTQNHEIHVSKSGNDSNPGTSQKPLQTIQAAANKAQPGDIITVHEGIFRERIDPPRGGESDTQRIVYQAAPGEKVEIKGSEIIKGWQKNPDGLWQISIANSFFGDYNPYADSIYGDWFNDRGRIHHTGDVYLNGKSLYEVETLDRVLHPVPEKEAVDKTGSLYTWYCETTPDSTKIWANFHEFDPNQELVEINVREACFYPRETGRNYITIRGFEMSQAATQWPAPTAEQPGLIGTNWSMGWIIEDNIVHDSRCAGITLGKDRASGHNVWSKDPSKGGAEHYNEVIERVLANGWQKGNIGSHIVRNNTIYNCEQSGICGSMGAAFCEITNNHIYNIWYKRQFNGAEISGIKFHGAIDTIIKGNSVHDSQKGLWLDWMTQGTHVSSNLFYNNNEDFFAEVNHGPYLVNNNLFLSATAIRNWSEGGAYIHNLIAGTLRSRPQTRHTPHLQHHSTALAGLSTTTCGDDRYYNNIFIGGTKDTEKLSNEERKVGYGLSIYDNWGFPVQASGNVYYNGAKPMSNEKAELISSTNPDIKIEKQDGHTYISFNMPDMDQDFDTQMITSPMLGVSKIGELPFENPDGTAFVIDTDYNNVPRDVEHPTPGPFEEPDGTRVQVR